MAILTIESVEGRAASGLGVVSSGVPPLSGVEMRSGACSGGGGDGDRCCVLLAVDSRSEIDLGTKTEGG